VDGREVPLNKRDPRVDQYIARSADFARPLLEHLRALVWKYERRSR
jgi:hypothetical protein